MSAQQENVAHHAQVEHACYLIACAGGEELAVVGLEECSGNGVFVAVERRQASSVARVPELYLVVF